jgi:hypothetical protein
MRKNIGLSLIRALTRILGLDVAKLDAEIARIDTLTPEQLDAENAKAMRKIGRMGNRGRTRALLDAAEAYGRANPASTERRSGQDRRDYSKRDRRRPG